MRAIFWRIGSFRSVQGLHRQQQDKNIRGDAEPSVCVPVDGDVDTRSRNGLVPGAGNEGTLPDRGAEGSHHVGEDNAEEHVARDLEPFLREDSEIEKQDRGLGEVDSKLIESLGNVEKLSVQITVISAWLQEERSYERA